MHGNFYWSRRFDFYLDVLKLAFETPSLRFHSNCFVGNRYKAGYALVRSISWKLKRKKYVGDVGILFDKSESNEIAITRKLLNEDHNFYNNVVFCTETDSKSFNAMQVVDLLTGCMSHKINCISRGTTDTKHKFIHAVEDMDNSLKMDMTLTTLWDYDFKKVQHFNLA